MSARGDVTAAREGAVTEVDVRPVIAGGGEPFEQIMRAVEELAPGCVLRIVSPFDPRPLHRVLETKGFARRVTERGEGHWESDYWRADEQEPLVLDVRGLAPPEPLERTLATLEDMAGDRVLLQVNDRVPAFLLPLLDERGYAYRIGEDERGTLTTIWRERAA
jgi:uncharacterized protein (DUF2249 family)